jgi:hypothetical protein
VRECPQAKFLIPVAPATPLSLRVAISLRASARPSATFAIDVAGHDAVTGKFIVGKFIREPDRVNG